MINTKVQARLLTRAKIFKALAHPSRLFMLEQLAEGERCVCELTDMIGADISTISKHLSVLKSAGVIHAEKRGLQVFYRLKMPCILRFFECVGDVIETNAIEQWDIANENERCLVRARRTRNEAVNS
jgi:DNA-binding transcriptional ArsR family regulator